MSSDNPKLESQGGNETETDNEEERQHLSDGERADTECGFWECRPALLQPCAKVWVFTGFFSLAALMTQTLGNYVNSQVTTLERQFGFSSRQTGIILAANDIGYLVCVLFMGYCASRIHIPRSLGWATITFSVSGIACALPHFLFGASVDPTADSNNSTAAVPDLSKKSAVFGLLCDVLNDTSGSCHLGEAQQNGGKASASQNIASVSLVIIAIGMALQGFGKAPRLLFTVTYVDDNTAKVNTGFYMGIVSAMAILGPALAFLMGGVFNGMYVTLEATKLTPRHPKWIGAWWLGYLMFGALSFLIALPLFCFPRRLPRPKKVENDTEDQRSKGALQTIDQSPAHKASIKPVTDTPGVNSNGNRGATPGVTPGATRLGQRFLLRHSREFLASLYRLLINPVYVCVVLSSCFTLFTVSGSSAYTPKYIESMFNLPAKRANYILAVQALCTSCLGAFIGGYLTKRMKMTAMTAIKFNIVVTGIGLAAQILGFFFYCEQPTVHNRPSEEISCNKGCNCQDNSYFPLCGEDGRTYYSPCHAGCLQVEQGEVYQNCSCLPGRSATAGTCSYGCYHLYTYIVALGVGNLFSTQSIIPKLIVLIRCVSIKDRSMGLAVSTFLTTLLGWLLGPIVFGNFIDTICTIWDINCDTRGRCLRYDNSNFRIQLSGYVSIGRACAVALLCIGFAYAKWTKCLDNTDAVAAGAAKSGGAIGLIINDSGGDAKGKINDANKQKQPKDN